MAKGANKSYLDTSSKDINKETLSTEDKKQRLFFMVKYLINLHENVT